MVLKHVDIHMEQRKLTPTLTVHYPKELTQKLK